MNDEFRMMAGFDGTEGAETSTSKTYFEDIGTRVDRGERPKATVRQLLAAFGAKRRGYWIVRWIRDEMASAGLAAFPDFESAYIDGEIEFRPAPPARTDDGAATPEEEAGEAGVGGWLEDELEDRGSEEIVVVGSHGELISGGTRDGSYRIGKLDAANIKPVSVAPNDNIKKALTLMLSGRYGQLPVMTGDRNVKGVISWRSIAKRVTLHDGAQEVRHAMDAAAEVSSDLSLFEAIPVIVRHDYVLVRSAQNGAVQGIVTTSDLALQFRELSEPYLLLGEIENYVRLILEGKFTQEQLAAARDPASAHREIGSVADLAFGEYIRVFQDDDHWKTCRIPLDKATFVQQLDRVRGIRNDVMHFDPDPLAGDDMQFLRSMADFHRELKAMGMF